MSKHERAPSYNDELKHPPTKRAKEIDQHPPIDGLAQLLPGLPDVTKVDVVMHWFRSKDIRMQDNTALDAAAQLAKKENRPLITAYLFSPKDMEWHGTSPARSDFILESFRLLQAQLAEKDIPLAFIAANERSDKTEVLLEFVTKWDVSHITANYEYEVDELRRDEKVVQALSDGKSTTIQFYHDQTVVEPGTVKTGSGGPIKVFTPYHKAWLSVVNERPELIDLAGDPPSNVQSAKERFKALFDSEVPSLPESKQFESKEEQDRIRKLWPAGHDAGIDRLNHFLKEKVADYAATRSEPAADSSSRMSAYFSSGTVSVREALSAAKKHNGGSVDFSSSGADAGIAAWVREIVFREFYRQVTVITPHTAMNLPQNLKFDFVQWEDDEEGWQKWCEGKTGVPFVDAGMRQLNTEAYMHNRLRMNTASYLRTNLLLDYRKGERYFAEHLIDWDLSNNTQGWEPSYTVFNPVIQAEKNDKNGDYIRRWVPELKGVKGKAVFEPSKRLSKEEFEKLGYPYPHVDFAETKERAVSRYKQDLANADP